MFAAPHPLDEEARVQSVRDLGLIGTPREGPFDRIARLAANVLRMESAYLSFIDQEREWFKAGHGWTAQETPRGDGLGSHALGGTGPFVVEDLRRDHRFADHPWTLDGVRAYAAHPIRGPDGGLVGVLACLSKRAVAVTRDGLDALRDLALLAEDEVASRSGRQADAARWSRLLLDWMPDPAAVVDPRGRIRLRNAAWSRDAVPGGLLDPGDAVGTNLIERLEALDGFLANPAHRLARGLRQALSGEQDRFRVDCQRGVEGARQELRFTVEAVEHRGATWALVRQQDRTQLLRRRRAEAAAVRAGVQLHALMNQERERDRRLQQLANAINGPVTPVRLELAMLRAGRRGLLSSEQETVLDRIERAVDRWGSMTEDLVREALSPVEAPLRAEPVDVHRLARDITGAYHDEALRAGIELRPPGEGDPLVVRTDPNRVREVLGEFIENALRVSQAGGAVDVSADRRGEEVAVAVHDRGQGIEPARLARIFEPDPESAFEANGPHLGLVRCQEVADELGGRVDAESAGIGQGASFALRLRDLVPGRAGE